MVTGLSLAGKEKQTNQLTSKQITTSVGIAKQLLRGKETHPTVIGGIELKLSFPQGLENSLSLVVAASTRSQ